MKVTTSVRSVSFPPSSRSLLSVCILFSATQLGGKVVKLNGPLARPVVGAIPLASLTGDGSHLVYSGDLDTDEVYELYSSPTDGSGIQVRLSAPMPSGGDVDNFQLAPSSYHAVYLADQRSNGRSELFSVRIDGSQPPVLLNKTPVSGGSVQSFGISADSLHVLYIGDLDTDTVNELYVAPIRRGAAGALKISGPLTSGGDVSKFQLSLDQVHAVYLADQDTDQVFELFSVDASLVPVKLNGPLVAGGDVGLEQLGKSYEISADGTRVVYRADQSVNDVAELFTVPIDGSAPALRLNANLPPGGNVVSLTLDPTSQRAVYVADQDTSGVLELYSVPIDASAVPLKLNAPLPSGAHVENTHGGPAFRISSNGARVVFVVNHSSSAQELYSAPIDGSSPAVRLDSTLLAGIVWDYQIRPDAAGVVFRAYVQGTEGRPVFSVPIDGSAPPLELSAPFPTGSSSDLDFGIVAGSDRVVYVGDQDVRNQQELYSVPIDGSTAPVRLSGTPVLNGDVDTFQLGVTGNMVSYRADQEIDTVLENFGVPADGNAPARKLHPELPRGAIAGDVDADSFELNSTGTYAVYRADQTTVGRKEIFSVRCDASLPAVRLDEEPSDGSPYQVQSYLAPDGLKVVLERKSGVGTELSTRPIDGSTSATLLATVPIPSYEVDVAISPDSRWLLYRESRRPGMQIEYLSVYSVPLDGSEPAVALSGWGVAEYRADPNSSRVVLRLGGDLFSVPIDGSAPPVPLHPALTFGIVQEYQIAGNGQSVVFRADQDVDGTVELFVAPIDGSAAPVQLSGSLLAPGVGGVKITEDSSRAVYTQDSAGVTTLMSARLDGAGAALTLAVLGEPWRDFELEGARAVYVEGPQGPGRRLYSVPVDGSAAAIDLSGPAPSGHYVDVFELAPDGVLAVYWANGPPPVGLFSVPLDGSQPPSALITPLPHAGVQDAPASVATTGIGISADSRYVVFRGNLRSPYVIELFRVPIDGAGPVRRISADLPYISPTLNGDVTGFQLAARGGALVYRADQEADEVFELFSIDGPDAPRSRPRRSP